MLAAATSWEQARRALRFASSTWFGRRVIAFDRLGSLDLLADLPVQRLLGTRDVMRVNEFAATETGKAAVDTLEAFCVFGSLRRTAAELLLWPIDEQGRIVGDDSYHSGPVEIRKLSRDELPREYLELVHANS